MMYTVAYAVMLNALLYTFILYHILFLLICDAFMCVHCIVFYSSATEALINNNNNNTCVHARRLKRKLRLMLINIKYHVGLHNK